MKYGDLPVNLGKIDIDVQEMMFYQYLPIKMPGSYFAEMEKRLAIFYPLINAVFEDLSAHHWYDSYVYLTAKRVFVNGVNSGNRPGYHSDGFLTDDLNYIWTDAEPTVFNYSDFELTLDHEKSLIEMERQAYDCNEKIYPVKSLLKLNQYVIHRSPDDCKPGYRTFVKISVSKDKYNLIGNSHNYEINYNWEMKRRDQERNHPVK